MIPLLDEERIEEAKNCHTCTEWLHRCKAECCTGFRTSVKNIIADSPQRIVFQFDGSADLSNYYRLHGGIITGKLVVILLEDFRVVKSKEHFYFYNDCSQFKDNKCEGWPDNRPKVCKNFNERTGEGSDSFDTDNCLCNYKGELN